MHTKSFHGVKHSLTKNEMVILKSIALGLDCDTIRLLVEISEYQYQTLCKNIFSKLQVGNSYAAVQYAFKNGLLNQHVNLRNNHHVLIYLDKEDEYQEEVISFWEAVRRKSSKEMIYQLPSDGAQFVTSLEINDLFIMGLEDPDLKLEKESNSFLAKHLYRVQKLSSKFYEFRLVHDNQINETDSPNYIRINNFGQRKTGWLTYSPIKVRMNSIGKLEYINEINQFNKTQKTYL